MAKSNKKKSNSRSSRKKEKNVNKDVTKKKDSKKNKYVLSDSDIEVIKAKTNDLIQQLEKRSKNPFLFRKRPLIKKQITDLQNWLKNKQFYLLDAELKAFEKLEKDEKQQLEQENQKEVKEVKEVKERKIKSFADIKNALKNFNAWPLYSRIKRINQNYTGKDKSRRIIAVVSVFVILLVVALIGLLLIVDVIHYGINGDTQRIGPLLCLVIPLVCMIFV